MSIQGPDVFFRRVSDERRLPVPVVEHPPEPGPTREQVSRWVRQERRRVFHDRIGWLMVIALAVGFQLSWRQSYLGETPFEFWTASAPALFGRAWVLSFPLPVLLAALRLADLDQVIRIPLRVGLLGWIVTVAAQGLIHRADFLAQASWVTAYAIGLLPIWVFAELGGALREAVRRAETRAVEQAMSHGADHFRSEG
jgi:hypothetical protein